MEAGKNSENVVKYAEVIEVLRAARYPAWLEVKWTLTEAEPQLTSPVPSGAEEVEAIVSGQASLSCSSAREAEVLVEQLSNSLSGMAGASPCPRLSDQGRGTPSREDVLRSPSPSAPLERRVAPQLKAFGLESLGGLPSAGGSPVSSAQESGERRRSLSPNPQSQLRCSAASQMSGGSANLYTKSSGSGRPFSAQWADEVMKVRLRSEPGLAERARAQTSLRAESFGAALARDRRWGSDRVSSSSRSSPGGSARHAMLSRGYLDRMREMSARQSSVASPLGTSRASRDVAVQAQSCVSTMSSLGFDTVASVPDTLPPNCKVGTGSPRTPNLNLPQMGGALPTAESTDSTSARLRRFSNVEARKSQEAESPTLWKSGSPQMRLASPRADLRSSSGRSWSPRPSTQPRAGNGHVEGIKLGSTERVDGILARDVKSPAKSSEGNGEGYMERVSQEVTKTKSKDVSEVSAGTKAVSEDVASRLHHSEPVVRQAAAAALGALGEVAAEHISELAMLIQDVDSGVRRAAAIALGNLGQKAVGHADALLAASQLDDDDDVRFHAAVALGMLGATSKVAERQKNGFHGKQRMPNVLA